MRLTEVEKDLFSVDPQYSLVHCVSADFALGAGIAKQFILFVWRSRKCKYIRSVYFELFF